MQYIQVNLWKHSFLILIMVGISLLASCKKENSSDQPISNNPADTTSTDTTSQDTSTTAFDCHDTTYRNHIAQGEMAWIHESSGLAASHRHPGYFWTHNDSGNENKLYLLNDSGVFLASFYVDGASNTDWEDICTGPGPIAGVTYIYVGDIGDNNAVRTTKTIYRIPEPNLDSLTYPVQNVHLQGAVALKVQYSEGKIDAESLFIDPITKDLYIVTKRGLYSKAFKYPYPQAAGSTFTMQKVATFDFNYATGADMSSDGDYLMVRTYTEMHLWKRQPGETTEQMMQREPFCEPYSPEPQGEAIAFTLDKSAYYTTSEFSNGVTPVLYRYPKN